MHGLYPLAHHLTFSDFRYRWGKKKKTYLEHTRVQHNSLISYTGNFNGAPAEYKLTVSRVCPRTGVYALSVNHLPTKHE